MREVWFEFDKFIVLMKENSSFMIIFLVKFDFDRIFDFNWVYLIMLQKFAKQFQNLALLQTLMFIKDCIDKSVKYIQNSNK